MRSVCLYASERLLLIVNLIIFHYNLDKLEILERQIIRKILGPRILRNNDEIYKNITETMKKRRLLFFGQFI